jgi:mannose-6-phosphate isomerase
MSQAYPLRFKPILRQYLWGGRRLETELGKKLGDGDRYAESWEIVDHGEDQSTVVAGPWMGKQLHELVTSHGSELFGRNLPQRQFPLLFKFLDAHKTLSVQVHPNDEQGARLDPPDLGKTEAWVVLTADPGSKIYAGLKPGVDRARLTRHLEEGTCDRALHAFEPKVGDCVFIRAGTVHALGAGLVIAEIQQASDTTFRLFDWNRVDADGNPRPLHIDEALEVIDFGRGPVDPQTPQRTEYAHVERLVECDKFVLDRWRFDNSGIIEPDGRFHLLAVVDGAMELVADTTTVLLKRGDTVLIPAACGEVDLTPRKTADFLDIYLP